MTDNPDAVETIEDLPDDDDYGADQGDLPPEDRDE